MYNLSMSKKLITTLFTLLTLTSCSYSFTNNPQGSIFDGVSNYTSNSYEYTSNNVNIPNDLSGITLSFYNDNVLIGNKYENKQDIISNMQNETNIEFEITNFNSCYDGINGLLVGEFGNNDGNINFKFDKSFQYVKVVATPVYSQVLDYDTNEMVYKIYQSAIAINDSKYINLESSVDETTNKPKITEAVFMLNSDTLNILSALDQVNIMEIVLY